MNGILPDAYQPIQIQNRLLENDIDPDKSAYLNTIINNMSCVLFSLVVTVLA